MVINTTFQSVHGAGEFQSHIGSFNALRFVSLKGNTPNFQRGNNVGAWTSEKAGYGLPLPRL